MQRLRDNPDAADQEYARIDDAADPGLTPHLTFDPEQDVAAPFIATGVRPRVAILREQGVNGHVEMAAAFDRAGFDAYDVHMSDIAAGRRSLAEFKGIVAGGGFSYGDVLGAGEGWAKSILFNPRVRDQFAAFFARPDAFALGVCNGCQMMSNLREMVPGAAHWPHFVRNASEQFEARFVHARSSAVAVALLRRHGGQPHSGGDRARRRAMRSSTTPRSSRRRSRWSSLRFVDHRGAPTEAYPYNCNGSPQGITGLTTADGRFTILMPHPERVHRTVQMSWHPDEWGDASPWMRMFRNARDVAGVIGRMIAGEASCR